MLPEVEAQSRSGVVPPVLVLGFHVAGTAKRNKVFEGTIVTDAPGDDVMHRQVAFRSPAMLTSILVALTGKAAVARPHGTTITANATALPIVMLLAFGQVLVAFALALAGTIVVLALLGSAWEHFQYGAASGALNIDFLNAQSFPLALMGTVLLRPGRLMGKGSERFAARLANLNGDGGARGPILARGRTEAAPSGRIVNERGTAVFTNVFSGCRSEKAAVASRGAKGVIATSARAEFDAALKARLGGRQVSGSHSVLSVRDRSVGEVGRGY
jgi:hypothetical protein